MSKKKTKKKSKALFVPWSVEEACRKMDTCSVFDFDPEKICKELTDALNEDRGAGEGNTERAIEATNKYLAMKTLDNCFLTLDGCHERYRSFLMKMAVDLIAEFDCKTAAEKSLVQLAVKAYYKYLRCSSAYTDAMYPDWLSHERNGMLSLYSKEADRAHRQYVTVLQMLRQMKQPSINLSIKTNNAFLAENQQINTVDEQATTPNQSDDQIVEGQ